MTEKITRRLIRNHIFKIKCGYKSSDTFTENDLSDLKSKIELQFQNGMTWDNFTFEWDVSSKDFYKVITQFEWDGRVDINKKCDPPAFTKQAL